MSKTRDPVLDTLKTVGILTIILAHCRALPGAVDYLRNYEVILLILISGALQGNSVFSNGKEYLQHTTKRITRLVIPTWVFLTVLFAGIFLAGKLVGQVFPYSPWIIAESYLLLGGVGYVWIMSVYCFVAVGAPLFHKAFNKYSVRKTLAVTAVFWGVYELLRFIVLNDTGNGVVHYLLKNVLLYAIGYSLLSIVGYFIYTNKSGKWWIFAAGLLAAQTIIQLIHKYNYGTWCSIGAGKYPPTFIYVSYALGMAVLLFQAARTWIPKGIPGIVGRFCEFVGRHSTWIYFHHVFLVFVWNMLIDKDNWLAMYVFLCAGALLLAWLQDRALSYITRRMHGRPLKIMQRMFG